MMKRFIALLVLLIPAVGGAAERITRFHADIDVLADGSMLVVETITVRGEGSRVKRGIYRDFPTTYKDLTGRRYTVGFALIGVHRDGAPEDYHTEKVDNGVRIYIGHENRFLSPGIYTYRLSYRTRRQLGFFTDHDELYWNVTGNGWSFPIDEASAVVRLPDTVGDADIRLEAYTGPAGTQGQHYEASLDSYRVAHFRTTRALNPREGLTIVMSWPKGHVIEPSASDRLSWFVDDNVALVAAFVGIMALLFYYGMSWHRVGRDPQPGVVIPHYEPPKGYSPASMRFVSRMGYDHKTFSSALVNLAVKGCLEIHEDDGDYVLKKNGDSSTKLAPGESVLLRRLFGHGREIALEKSNHERIEKALEAHENSLKTNYETLYFMSNSGYAIFGVLISVITLAAAVLLGHEGEQLMAEAFLIVWLSGWTFGVFTLAGAVSSAWRGARGISSTAGAMGITLFALPFFAFEGVGIFMLATTGGVDIVVALLVMIFVNWLFYELMKAPTRLGRKLLDRIDGFRDYLDVAEKDELHFKHPPERTPQLFERFLPYAMALGVEQAWGEKFADVIAAAERRGEYERPGWYHGGHWRADSLGSFTSGLGNSLSHTVAASSTAPGSSSGAGGGGSSGGGGGGGGGGGW